MLAAFAAEASDSGHDTLALVVSGVAAVIALGAFLHSVLTSRSERNDRRRGLELVERQLADERRRHEEQVALERERRLDEKRADLVARQGSRSGGEREDDHEIHLTNRGRSTARRIKLRVVDEMDEALTREFLVDDLVPDGSVTLRVYIPREVSRGLRTLLLRVTWQDGAGAHDEVLLELEPLR